ncbi:F-box/LRR-repeat protein 16 [Galendromus occidentalis]|uniref:F-box/LRR-repeat protein 16 n=1 Tax=Galendromus occidentalis TaxID=34638 RepID=A0AAJ7SDZ5_9ACAR|nr:F-box/LRR-repeat protein 16 [Galendromus occidentalis]
MRTWYARKRLTHFPCEGVSFTKRAAAELSRCFNGLAVRAKAGASNAASTLRENSKSGSHGMSSQTASQGGTPGNASLLDYRKRRPGAARELWNALTRPKTVQGLLEDAEFLRKLFQYFGGADRCVLAQVCKTWRDILYHPRYWKSMVAVIKYRDLRGSSDGVQVRRQLYDSLEKRSFTAVCLFYTNEEDIFDFMHACPRVEHITKLSLRCSSISDRALEALIGACPKLTWLELFGCNEITDAGLWASLTPKIQSLALADCINVADDTIAAVAQLVPQLKEFNLQAYHVTDASIAYLGPRQGNTLEILRLRSCWELTNSGVLSLSHSLPSLTELSLSGCTKISDDGVELLAENLNQLEILDLSWCPRITDASLEFIACDMGVMKQLTLDRCVHVTDIGLGYLSTMASLESLYLRWCSQISDFGLAHLATMKALRILSLAGCHQLTSAGLSSLYQLRELELLELTNTPGATSQLVDYLEQQMLHCLVCK